ncbi:unnamed protein product [Closterium sp. NIES-53]
MCHTTSCRERCPPVCWQQTRCCTTTTRASVTRPTSPYAALTASPLLLMPLILLPCSLRMALLLTTGPRLLLTSPPPHPRLPSPPSPPLPPPRLLPLTLLPLTLLPLSLLLRLSPLPPLSRLPRPPAHLQLRAAVRGCHFRHCLWRCGACGCAGSGSGADVAALRQCARGGTCGGRWVPVWQWGEGEWCCQGRGEVCQLAGNWQQQQGRVLESPKFSFG